MFPYDYSNNDFLLINHTKHQNLNENFIHRKTRAVQKPTPRFIKKTFLKSFTLLTVICVAWSRSFFFFQKNSLCFQKFAWNRMLMNTNNKSLDSQTPHVFDYSDGAFAIMCRSKKYALHSQMPTRDTF